MDEKIRTVGHRTWMGSCGNSDITQKYVSKKHE